MTPAAAFLAALQCLAANVYHEARGEPFYGQVAVAQVTLRRAQNDVRQVCEEVHRPGQFSWTSMKKRTPDRADPAWQRAQTAAVKALQWSAGDSIKDYSGGATHYHATWIAPPYWADKFRVTTRIGRHIFYRR
jgi:spore germination cell wall hydrolase CwlJ-like protein